MSLHGLGLYPAPQYALAHLTDIHLLADGARQYDVVDPEVALVEALRRVRLLDPRPDAIVVTGDLADRGEPAAYARVKGLVEEVAADLDATIVWSMGNHDDRAAYAEALFGVTGEDGRRPQDASYRVGGLRIVSLDSSVPGHHHGDVEPAQLDWLREELSTPAPDGTVLCVHHPPMPMPMDPLSAVIELDDQPALAEVLRGTDVRAILSGHVHYPTYSTFAGIPVMVGAASCYSMDLASEKAYRAIDAGRAFAVCHLYESGAGGIEDAPVVHTVVPLEQGAELIGVDHETAGQLVGLSPEERRALLSVKAPPGAPEW